MNKKIIIIAVAVLALGAGAGLYFLKPEILPGFIQPAAAENSEAKKTEPEKKRAHTVDADLDVFVVNLLGEGPARYLRTTLSLGVASEEEKEEIKKVSGPVRHAVIMYLTERRVEELLNPEGKNRLRAELQKSINAAIGKKVVHDVYFKEFLIQ